MLRRAVQPDGAFRSSPYVESARRMLPARDDIDAAQRDRIASSPTIEAGKIQFALLDLVQAERLSGDVRLLDLAPASGERLLATLDFLLLWWNVCELHGQPFPITDLQLRAVRTPGSDQQNLEFVLEQFANLVRARSSSTPSGTVADWAGRIKWIDAESIERQDGFDLILGGADSISDSSSALGLVGPDGNLLCEVAGEQSSARELARWRRRALDGRPDLFPIGPCGQEFGHLLPACCDSCWPVRTERFESPTLSPSPGHTLDSADDQGSRGFEIASWSYTIIGRRADDSERETASSERSGGSYRFIGAFRGRTPAPSQPRSDAEESSQLFLKLCPATNGGVPTLVQASDARLASGFSFGDRFDLTVLEEDVRGDGVVLHPASQEIGSGPLIDAPFIPEPSEQTRAGVHQAMDELAYRYFGFERLREFQYVILERVLAGKSILGIAATGGGKSECFILPAMLIPGITVVVSPLKSLMMDQYQERISRRYGLSGRATWINGDLSQREQQLRLERMIRGDFDLIYLTPEQLDKKTTVEALYQADQRIGIRYLAIDEAHCISQWGHDFRPSYLSTLRRLADAGVEPVRIALTATASPQVRADICEELGLSNAPVSEGGDVYIYSSNRPELNLITRVVPDRTAKAAQIADELRPFANDGDRAYQPGSAIVFMPWTSGKDDRDVVAATVTPHVTSMASYLEQELKTRVSIYHSQMEQDGSGKNQHRTGASSSDDEMAGRERNAEQNAFIRGERRIMVATKGFGMGIDKPDIRTVIHVTPPGNLEAYVQEAGRAGRDGDPANVVLYYSPHGARDDDFFSDYQIQQNFLERKLIHRVDVQALARYVLARHRAGATSLKLTPEELIPHMEQYRADRNEQPKQFRNRRTYPTESSAHRLLLDRGHQYQEWAEYLDRIIRELDSFNTLLSQSDRGAIFDHLERANRVRDADYQAMTLDEKRRTFGARYRAWPRQAESRARAAGRDKPDSIDDWFGQNELPWPRGWNVKLGDVFNDQDAFVSYIYAFCDAHEQRYTNAQDSYTRLLTDYLGLRADGTVNPTATAECLRAVMLGYLKTNEIVQDGNCRSCSNCVPDEKFDRYTLDERRDAVIRIDNEIQLVLDWLEETSGTLPDDADLEPLLQAMNRQTASAHALQRYVAGWSGRILDEQPEHVGVRWLRVRLFEHEEAIELREDELVNHLRRLVQYIQDQHLARVRDVLHRFEDNAGLSNNPNFARIRAEIAHRMSEHGDEADALERLSRLLGDTTTTAADDTSWVFQRMRDLHAPGGPIPDRARYVEAAVQLGRISATVDEAATYYRQFRDTWRWDDVLDELRLLDLYRTTRVPAVWGLLRIWLESDDIDRSGRIQPVLEYLSSARPEVIDRASTSEVRHLIARLQEDDLSAHSELTERLAVYLVEEDSDVDRFGESTTWLLQQVFYSQDELPLELASLIANRIVSKPASPSQIQQLQEIAPSVQDGFASLAGSLAAAVDQFDEQSIVNWLRVFSLEVHQGSPELCRRVIAALTELPSDPELKTDLLSIAATGLWQGDPPDTVHRHWISINRQNPGILGEYIQDSLEANPPLVELAELAFARMLENPRLRDLGPFLKWANGSESVSASGRITDAAALFQLLTRWAAERKSSGSFELRTDPGIYQVEFEEWCREQNIEHLHQINPDDYRQIVEIAVRGLRR